MLHKASWALMGKRNRWTIPTLLALGVLIHLLSSWS